MKTIFDKNFLEAFLEQAKENPRLRAAYDLRTTADDVSQRILNALMPGTAVPLHRHPNSTENVLCLCGSVDEVFFDEGGKEVDRIHLSPAEGAMGCVVPKGQWHTVEVLEPSVIYEGKDGKYGEDGTKSFDVCDQGSTNANKEDLQKQITYLIGQERADGNLKNLTPHDISNHLHVPLEEVEQAMKEMGL